MQKLHIESGMALLAGKRFVPVAFTVETMPKCMNVGIKRFHQNLPGIPVTLASTYQTLDEVTIERQPLMEQASNE